MATLHSLQICGIRSFSPENKETITFEQPLTLFLGQNGCGKTTIIESIRYALTSELPSGSSSGQGFLNDPKMSNKTSTKASIKIKFLDFKGNQVTVCRIMNVSTKQDGNLTFKKVDTTIRQKNKDDPNKTHDISGRCIDADSYCSTALNVPKTILNNVLFCHQENSSWPLDESKKLKEKFDEIFDASKYNKCIDTLRKFIKDKKTDTIVLKANLDIKKSIKDNVEKLRAKCEEKNNKLTEVLELIENKNNELKPIEDRRQEIIDLEETLGNLQKQLTEREAERKGLQEQQETIKKHISYIFDGSDEDLKNKINSFEADQALEEEAVRKLEKNKKDLITEGVKISKNIQLRQIEIGKLKGDQKQHENKITEVNGLMEDLRSNLQIEKPLDMKDRVIAIRELRNAQEKSEECYRKLLDEADFQEKKLQDQIDEAREQYASTRQKITSKNKYITECETKLKNIKNKLDEIGMSDSQLKIMGNKIEQLKNTLSKLESSFDKTQKLQEIEELQENVERKEQYLDKLDREYRLLQENYATEQNLESKNASLLEKQGEIKRIRNKHLENLKKLFGDNLPEINFKKSVMEIQYREEAKFKTITNRISILEKEQASTDTRLAMEKKKLENQKEKLRTVKRQVEDICKTETLEDMIKKSFIRKEKLQKDKGQYSSAKIMYEAFINKFEDESPCCPVCQTNFTEKKSLVKEIIAQLRAKIENIPMQLARTERQLGLEETAHSKLLQLKPLTEEINTISNETIPLLETEIKRATEEYEDKSMELVSEKACIEQPQKLIEICKVVINDMILLDQYLSDVDKLKAAIEQLQQRIITVASNRTRQETEAEVDTVKADLINLKTRYSSTKKMLDQHIERCQNLSTDLQNETLKQIDMKVKVKEKPVLEAQLAEYNKELKDSKQEVEELNIIAISQDKDVQNAVEERQNIVKNNRKTNEKEQSKITANKNTLTEIRKLQESLDCYIRNRNADKLESAIEELANLKVTLDKLEKEKNDITEAISNKNQLLAKKESDYRALNDNITLREKQKMEIKLTEEIKSFRKNIGDYNYRSLYEEKQKIEKILDKEKRYINTLMGKHDEIEQQIKDLEKELTLPENKNAYNNFKKQFYELRILELTLADLGNYVNILERSVLRFHEERMVNINRTIRELWRNIYRGNDIDYIEIKTNENMTGGVTKRRTYNYKVVQVKNNVELEMRGRCSAGQKVLACLVIRMALAETFSANCGILALDEPTTNLDKENIMSLSDALSRIITAREKEKNFQLLIITHDEEFLQTLTRGQSLNCYWRVQRNQGGFSTVKKHIL